MVSEEKMFEIVDGRRTTDDGLSGILLANPWAFGSGVLIKEVIIICLIRHFKADFLWKVSLKTLNSGLILKIFTHVIQHTVCIHFQNTIPYNVSWNHCRRSSAGFLWKSKYIIYIVLLYSTLEVHGTRNFSKFYTLFWNQCRRRSAGFKWKFL